MMSKLPDSLQRAQARYNANNPRITFRPLDLLPDVDARTPEGINRAVIVRRDLARYYALLRAELVGLGLSRGELIQVLESCRGLFLDNATPLDAAFIWARVADTYPDAGLLVQRLRSLTQPQVYALVDAIGMYGARPGQGAEAIVDALGLTEGAP